MFYLSNKTLVKSNKYHFFHINCLTLDSDFTHIYLFLCNLTISFNIHHPNTNCVCDDSTFEKLLYLHEAPCFTQENIFFYTCCLYRGINLLLSAQNVMKSEKKV